jgi:amidase
VGLKPARGRISNAPVGDYQNGIATHGILAHTVADTAALLDIMSGYTTGDPYWLPNPEISFLESISQKLPQLRIAFATSIPPIGEVAEIYQENIQLTARRLEEMGHILEQNCPDFNNFVEPFKKVWQAGVTSSGIPLECLSEMNRWIAKQSGSAGEYLQAVTKMQLISRQIVAFFDQFDVLLLPVYMHPPIKVGEWANLTPEETMDKIINWVAPCPPANASGLPAITFPTGNFDQNGLPICLQLVGKPAAEATILALAMQLEKANPLLNQHPSWVL